MYINNDEFMVAFLSVQKEYPKISRQLAESFISKLGDAVEKSRGRRVPEKFPDLLRQTLNDSHVWKRIDREPYKVLAGKFFGRRGGHAAHKGQRPKPPRAFTPPPALPSVVVFERPNGQLAWKI